MTQYNTGWLDLKQSVLDWPKWFYLTRFDLKLRYRRTLLGPYWVVITTLVSIMALGFVFGAMFNHNQDNYFAYLASGVMIWQYITTTILGSAEVFNARNEMIKNLPQPIMSFVFRMVAFNFLILIHSLAVYLLFVIYYHLPVWLTLHWFIFGLALLTFNLFWISTLIGILCTRYRDLIQLLGTVMSLMFIVTPIFWVKQVLIDRPYVTMFNPFVHMIEIVRDPMLGQSPNPSSVFVCLAMLVIGGTGTFLLFAKKRARIVFWV